MTNTILTTELIPTELCSDSRALQSTAEWPSLSTCLSTCQGHVFITCPSHVCEHMLSLRIAAM